MANQDCQICAACTQDKKLTILKGNFTPFHPQGFNYKLDSVESVVNLVKTKGSVNNTVIFYDDHAIRIIIDDSVIDRPKDTGKYPFTSSDQFDEWESFIGHPLSQKEFTDFLKRRPHGEVADVERLLAAVQKLKLVTSIVGDYQYDDNNNYTVMFKTSDGEDSAKLPSIIEVTLPLLNESDKTFNIPIELELNKPKSEDQKPTFTLECSKIKQFLREATAYEVAKLKEKLPGYLILNGSPS